MAKITKTIVILIAIIFYRCASQLPPGGGPIDVIPPSIIEVFPLNGTINYNKNYFEITFSEYVDKRTVRDAIFISPPTKYPFELEWKGRTLRVNFLDTLKKNTTYTITIGAGVEDLTNHNKMIEPFSFAFSTGEKIDSGKISGKIYDKNPTGVLVFAYKQNTNSINPLQQKPDYISQVGSNGKYSLVGLSYGEYLVMAIRDKLRDFLFNKNEDEYGVQFKKVVLSSYENTINNVDFFLTKEDTAAPKILTAVMKDKNHLLVEFNKQIDSTRLSSQSFYIYDSLRKIKIVPKYFFKGDAKANQFYLAILDTLITNSKIYLFVNDIWDKKGNFTNKEKVHFLINNDKDTVAPKIIKIESQYPNEKIDFDNPELIIKFDDGIEEDSLRNAISILDNKGIKYPFEIKKIDDASFNIFILSKLKQRTQYKLNINLSKLVDVAGNKVDSLYTYNFLTASELDFAGVSGISEITQGAENVFVVLERLDGERNIYKQKVDNQRKFNFNKVWPGKYLIWSFVDRNKDSNYTFGKVFPFEFSEEFKFYPDTLNLRARWPVGDIIIK